jgi:hypothetical protein
MLVALAFLLQGATAQGAFTVYSGIDLGAASSTPRPNSAAAASSFDTAAALLGAPSVITFEDAPLGNFTSLAVSPGVTLTGKDYLGAMQAIHDAPQGSEATYGYNTTASGSHFLYAHGGTATFTFDTGVQAFGAYISGIQFASETITFNDGASQSVTIPTGDGTRGGIAFVGFVDPGASIKSITINASGVNTSGVNGPDFLAIDDVRFGPAGTTVTASPAPGGLVLLGSGGFVALLSAGVRRRFAGSRPSA